MLTSIKQRFDREDEGFTLIELMVVLLIIAILLAIAIPTFLGARNTANARSSQENLRNALTAEQSYWTSNQTFSATVATMQGLEPSLGWTTTAPTTSGGNAVYVTLGTNSIAGDTIFLQAYAKDGNCYTIEATNDPAFSSAAANAGKQTTGYAENSGACVAPSSVLTYVAPSAGSAAGHVATTSAAPTTYYNSF